MKNTLFSLALLLCLGLAGVSAQEAKKEAAPAVDPANEVAVIKTAFGEMVIEFWTDAAPETIKNFKKLAKQGFYDGTAFHRIVKDFMIQGGDPKSKDDKLEGEWGTGDAGYKIKDEFNAHPHVRGVISMAHSRLPDSAGSQFFICDNSPSWLDGQYTTFGHLIKGSDVLTKIASVPVGPNGNGEISKPMRRVNVESIKIVDRNSLK